MGVRLWRSFFVLWWVYFLVIRVASAADTICDVRGCNCTIKAVPWKNVNCTFNDVQELTLSSRDVSNRTAEIFMSGGKSIILGSKTFRDSYGFILFHVEGTSTIIMEKQSFYNLTHPSLHIRIRNCDHLIIKTGAFEAVQSSITIEISRCASVKVEKSAFNKLENAQFNDISKLSLDEGTFELINQGISKHGLVTTIFFNNVRIPSLPQQTFFSSLAEIKIHNSVVNDIKSKAFWASQIDSISITNSRIDYLRTDAFVGRMLVLNFKLSNCTIKKIETGAVVAAFSNLTVEHSRITDIATGAINSTVANADITGNEIMNFHSMGFVFQDWNKILIEQNIIMFLHSNFLVAPINVQVVQVSFVSNDVLNIEPGALSFVPELEDRVFLFKNNFFNQTCHCNTDEWIVELTTANVTSKKKLILNNTFCTVNSLLSRCFELQVGVINLQNFTELVCNTNNTIICDTYKGETKIVNTTSIMFTEDVPPVESNWIILIISLTAVLVGSVFLTFIIMLIKGSRWLKRKGYFRNIQYSPNEHSNEEENTIETVDENDKADISEDLTMELLQDLSKKLDDPNTHQEASEMIEQLYQKYIRNNGVENNNQQDEEAHLYEELGNLQMNGIDHDPNKQQNGPRSILRLMEEKFNTQFEEIDADDTRPALVGEYSEPSDAAVHLYSELKQNKDSESENKDSLKSRGSSNMAFRPLPDKPGSSKM